MKHSKLPDYFLLHSWLIVQAGTHAYNTRNNLYLLPRINHKFSEFYVRYQLPRLLNNNVRNIIEKVNTHSEQGFTIYVKRHLISQYSEYCDVINCYICGNNLINL